MKQVPRCDCGFLFPFCVLPPNTQVLFKQLRKRKYLLFCRVWFPRMVTTSFQPETKILFNFPSLQLFMKNIKLRNKGFPLGGKNERAFSTSATSNDFSHRMVTTPREKCCDSITGEGNPFSFFLVCCCVNNLKVSNFQTRLFFVYKNGHQVPLLGDAAQNPGAQTGREWIDTYILRGVKDITPAKNKAVDSLFNFGALLILFKEN